jgi:hypothetical protein
LAAAGAVGSTNGKAKTGAAPAPVVGKRKPGMRVDDATRKAIEEALKAGTTGTSLANKYGLSYQTIHIMKQRLGLVKVTKASRRSKSK